MTRRGRNRRGMLTFEWVLVTAILAVGLVGGVYALRDTIVNHYRGLIQSICQVEVGSDTTN